MSQRDAERELAMDHAAKLKRAETHLPLARLFAAATLIGLGQATSVVLDSVAGPQDALHEFLYGAIDVLAKAALLLLALDTAATGFTLVCTQAGGVRSPSTEVIAKRHTRLRWLS
jgi:phosphotransferase system  glucose/maltose/N-acetylglucosamine-specific IIC component